MNRPQALGSSCLSRLLVCALLVLPVGAADAGASREPIQISGVRAELADTTQTYTKNATPYWRWRTDWLLHWERLARASHYELQFLTSEGMSGRSRRFIAPPFRLEVAKGDNLQAAEFPTRAIQLLTIQSLLAVRIIAHFADGSQSLPSQWLSVGRT